MERHLSAQSHGNMPGMARRLIALLSVTVVVTCGLLWHESRDSFRTPQAVHYSQR
jgi:hypothetical protein